jgi:hypothetical protein
MAATPYEMASAGFVKNGVTKRLPRRRAASAA